jgi:hypothetical protein
VNKMYRLILVGLLGGMGCAGEEQKAGTSDHAALGVPEGERIALGGISVIVPEGWVVQQPSSSMRKAQYALGRQAADAEDGELAVFYFGSGSAGGVAANLDRWRKQITPAEGSPPSDPQTRTVDGMAVTVLDLEGLYKAGMGPMMAPGPPKSAYRMVAAIVESPAGAYYFKLTGPSATIAHWRTSFAQCINSAKKAGS